VRPGSSDNAYAEALNHMIIHRTMPSAPLWFRDGFSAYVRLGSTGRTEDKRTVACYGFAGASDWTFIPLPKVLAMKWEETNGVEARSWYKQTARMLIDFTLHAEDGKRAPALAALVGGFLEGKEISRVIADAFPDLSLDELGRRVASHSSLVTGGGGANARGLCPLQFEVPAEKEPDLASERKLEPVPPEEMKPLLEGLLRLPLREDGYPVWYPPEAIDKAR
jgi:hypothetical protein